MKSARNLWVVLLTVALAFSPIASASAVSIHQAPTFKQLLTLLKVKQESASSSYNRDLFNHWIDSDGNGCDTRDDVLAQESKTPVSCNDLSMGSWISVYDGVKISDSSALDIDHFIPLKEAWESGASTWDSDTRERFANDLEYSSSLIAVSASSNRSKSDRDPSSWLPTSKAFTCQYVGRWVAVKYRWSLSIDATEKKVLASKLATCGNSSNVVVPTKAKISLDSKPSPSSTVAPPSNGVDPKFASCAEALRNGYKGPYKKGVDPEYAFYDDRDGDGLVCE